MSELNIDNYLRDNKPVVKEDPAFLLETARRMDAVEGIKNEVDRQRRYGRTALIVTLIIGIAVGSLVTLFAYLYPVDLSSAESGIVQFLQTWKKYLILPVAAMAIALGLILMSGGKKTVRL